MNKRGHNFRAINAERKAGLKQSTNQASKRTTKTTGNAKLDALLAKHAETDKVNEQGQQLSQLETKPVKSQQQLEQEWLQETLLFHTEE